MSENTNNVEAILTEIRETLQVEKNVSEEIAKSADGLINAQMEKFESLAKSVDTLSAKLDAITAAIEALVIPTKEEIDTAIEAKAEEISKNISEASAQNEEVLETLTKKVEDLENEPVIKSATVIVEEKVETEEVVETPAPTRQELINKAMAELPTADHDRKAQLFKAISRLEAGVELAKITF